MDMNLYELIRGRKHYLPEARVKDYMYQLLKSMDHMHRNGIFHRCGMDGGARRAGRKVWDGWGGARRAGRKVWDGWGTQGGRAGRWEVTGVGRGCGSGFELHSLSSSWTLWGAAWRQGRRGGQRDVTGCRQVGGSGHGF
eukprot:181796-Chlamydomonas_euryale.AAC.1